MVAETDRSGDELHPGPADETVVSLSQILLAPLDAIFKSQVHAARSFLNFVLQLSYPHKEDDGATTKGTVSAAPTPAERQADTIYTVDFVQEVPSVLGADASPRSPKLQKVSVPALALVPLRPLAVDEAEFEMAMTITWIGPHNQTRQDQRRNLAGDEKDGPSGEDRPWYLVDDPISLRGHVAPVPPADAKADQPHIKVNVKIGPVPMPSGLEKLLTTLTQSASVADASAPNKQP